MFDYEGTPVSRGDLFINRVLTVLNGARSRGVGKCDFFDDMSRYVAGKAVVGNSKTFTGCAVFMAVNLAILVV